MRSLLMVMLLTLPLLAQEAQVVGLVYSTQASSTSLTGQHYVEGAEVRLGGLSARTDAMGVFELKKVPVGRHTLVIEKDGFVTARQELEVTAGPLPVQTRIALTPAAGRVSAGRGTVYVSCRSRPVMINQSTQWFRGRVQNGQDPLSIACHPPLDPEAPHSLGDNPTTFDENLLLILPEAPPQARTHKLGSLPYWLCFTPDGSALYTSYASHIEVTDPLLHTPLATLPVAGVVSSLQLCADKMLVTVSGQAPAVLVIDSRTHQVEASYPVGPNQPSAAQLLGERLYVALYAPHNLSESGQVICLSTRTGEIMGRASVGACPTAMVVSGPHLLVVNSFSASLSVVDATTLQVVKTVGVGVQPQRLVVSSDGTRALVTNRSSDSVSLLDTRSLTVVRTTRVGAIPVGVAFSLDGSRAWVACTGDGTVRILDGRSGEQLHATNPLPLACPFGVAVRP